MNEETLSKFVEEVDRIYKLQGQELPDTLSKREQCLLYWITTAFQRSVAFREGLEAFAVLYSMVAVHNDSTVARFLLDMINLTEAKRRQYKGKVGRPPWA